MDTSNQARIAREAKAMTKNEVILKAMDGKISWNQAADICRVSARHMRRLKQRYEQYGYDGLRDYRGGKTRRKRIAVKTVNKLLKLRQDKYMDFSVQHFWQHVTEKHGLKISYTWTKVLLQQTGLAERAVCRGKHRRKRERRAMRGMMLHCDGSRHGWVQNQAAWDLILVQDDANSEVLYGQFVPEEGTESTLWALEHILRNYGRFCEFYTDRGSHFCRTSVAGQAPDEQQDGQVSRVLKTLGIQHILARSPQARGRSERTFGTFQNRLPQELNLAGITDYEKANDYLNHVFIPDYNRRFTVQPAQKESAFVPLVGIDLKLVLSIQHARIVNHDNTVQFQNLHLQLPGSEHRAHFARCPVTVHQCLDHTVVVTYHGRVVGAFLADGSPLQKSSLYKHKKVA